MINKKGFTLAEVLITLGIIGIVAALTLPAFISNVQGRIQAKRVENINQKLSKVTDKMAVQSGLIGYPDTMAFVQEMKKHMSIAKVCDNSHLSECWGSTEVDVGKDKPWEISKTKTAKTLKIGEPDNWADTVGIVTADGTPMILSYDKECNFDVLIDTETAYRVIIEFDNCMGEILVNQPYFAPYRFVKIEMLSSVCVEDTHIFIWYDSESDSVDEILFQIRKCFDIAKKYNGK